MLHCYWKADFILQLSRDLNIGGFLIVEKSIWSISLHTPNLFSVACTLLSRAVSTSLIPCFRICPSLLYRKKRSIWAKGSGYWFDHDIGDRLRAERISLDIASARPSFELNQGHRKMTYKYAIKVCTESFYSKDACLFKLVQLKATE